MGERRGGGGVGKEVEKEEKRKQIARSSANDVLIAFEHLSRRSPCSRIVSE